MNSIIGAGSGVIARSVRENVRNNSRKIGKRRTRGKSMLECNKIYNRDCFDFLKVIDDKSVDAIIIDPPYGINYHSGRYGIKGNPHAPIQNDDKLFIPLEELWRVLKEDGALFIFYHKKNL